MQLFHRWCNHCCTSTPHAGNECVVCRRSPVTLTVTQIPEGFVCNGEVWVTLSALKAWNLQFWPTVTFDVKDADEATRAYWQAALTDGTAKIRE